MMRTAGHHVHDIHVGGGPYRIPSGKILPPNRVCRIPRQYPSGRPPAGKPDQRHPHRHARKAASPRRVACQSKQRGQLSCRLRIDIATGTEKPARCIEPTKAAGGSVRCAGSQSPAAPRTAHRPGRATATAPLSMSTKDARFPDSGGVFRQRRQQRVEPRQSDRLSHPDGRSTSDRSAKRLPRWSRLRTTSAPARSRGSRPPARPKLTMPVTPASIRRRPCGPRPLSVPRRSRRANRTGAHSRFGGEPDDECGSVQCPHASALGEDFPVIGRWTRSKHRDTARLDLVTMVGQERRAH